LKGSGGGRGKPGKNVGRVGVGACDITENVQTIIQVTVPRGKKRVLKRGKKKTKQPKPTYVQKRGTGGRQRGRGDAQTSRGKKGQPHAGGGRV